MSVVGHVYIELEFPGGFFKTSWAHIVYVAQHFFKTNRILKKYLFLSLISIGNVDVIFFF